MKTCFKQYPKSWAVMVFPRKRFDFIFAEFGVLIGPAAHIEYSKVILVFLVQERYYLNMVKHVTYVSDIVSVTLFYERCRRERHC